MEEQQVIKPPNPQPVPPVVKKSISKILFIILGCFLLVAILGGAAFAFYESQREEVATNAPEPSVTPSPTPDPMADWTSYSFSNVMTFKYPPGWTLKQDSSNDSYAGIAKDDDPESAITIYLNSPLSKQALFNNKPQEVYVGGAKAIQDSDPNLHVIGTTVTKPNVSVVFLGVHTTNKQKFNEEVLPVYHKLLSTVKFPDSEERPISADSFMRARNTERRNDILMILNGVWQYAAENNGVLPPGIPKGTPVEVAFSGANICTSLVPTYLVALPVDPYIGSDEVTACTSEYKTGYTIYQDPNSTRIWVAAPYAEDQEQIIVSR